jgi:hypothetical protein
MSAGTTPTLRPVADVLDRARRFAADGWRPTHQEINQLVALIDRQTEQLARQPIGYLIAGPYPAAPGLWLYGEDSVGGHGWDLIGMFQAQPTPMEVPDGYRVVAVYEVSAVTAPPRDHRLNSRLPTEAEITALPDDTIMLAVSDTAHARVLRKEQGMWNCEDEDGYSTAAELMGEAADRGEHLFVAYRPDVISPHNTGAWAR